MPVTERELAELEMQDKDLLEQLLHILPPDAFAALVASDAEQARRTDRKVAALAIMGETAAALEDFRRG